MYVNDNTKCNTNAVLALSFWSGGGRRSSPTGEADSAGASGARRSKRKQKSRVDDLSAPSALLIVPGFNQMFAKGSLVKPRRDITQLGGNTLPTAPTSGKWSFRVSFTPFRPSS